MTFPSSERQRLADASIELVELIAVSRAVDATKPNHPVTTELGCRCVLCQRFWAESTAATMARWEQEKVCLAALEAWRKSLPAPDARDET